MDYIGKLYGYIEDYIGLKEGKTVGEDETQNTVWKFGEEIEK